MARLAVPVLLALGVVGVLAAQAQALSCPQPATQTNFDAEKYLGEWYEIQRVARSFEKYGQCGTAHYSWKDSTKSAVNVINTAYVPLNGMTNTVNLLATPTVLTEGKLTVTYPSMPSVAPSMYWVLGTDYVNYAVVYSCGEPASSDSLPAITLWVLSRTKSGFDTATMALVQAILATSKLPLDALEDVQQYDCRETTCTACPGAKANLDLSKLKGRWWEVEHSPFATGGSQASCTLYELSATADGIKADSYTSTTTGEKITDSARNITAKWANTSTKDGAFTVVSTGAGDANDNFCVVDTDYDNWAVLSGCGAPPKSSTTPPPAFEFVPATRGGVWLLARQRGLSAEHQMQANKALLTAGVPAAVMVATPSTPCPAQALQDDSTGSATLATATPVVLLASLLVAAASL